MGFDKTETTKLQNYLQTKLGNTGLNLRARATSDSLELWLKDEFIGVVYKDEEDGDVSYDLNISILGMDVT